MQICLNAIGIIHSPFHEASKTPIQPVRSQAEGWVVVDAEWISGLDGIGEFSHIHLIYAFHRTQEITLQVTPFLDDTTHGIFATRHPHRPNHIGISLVEVLEVQGNRIRVGGIDVLDGTPLLDIKPYVADFDRRENVRCGWYEKRARP